MKKILIVDDNANLISYMVRKLREAGHEVVTASDGLAAAQQLITYTPDVIFIDYFLPTINGDVLCRIIRRMEHMKNTYIVIMSAAAKEMDLDPEKMSADALIAKGTFKDTAEHFLSVIKDSEGPHGNMREYGVTMGTESVFPRQMTIELLAKYRHLQLVLDSISEGIIEVYRGRVVYANPAAAAILEKEPDCFPATLPLSLFEESERQKIESLMESEESGRVTVRWKKPQGDEDRIVSIRKLPLQGDPDTVILLIADITEHVRDEEELRSHQSRLEALVQERTAELGRASEKLHQSQKMEAIGILAGGIAHDFNNILTALIGYATLVQQGLVEDDPLRAYVDQILSSSEKAAQLTHSLLAFSRKQPITLKPVDVNRSIMGTEKLLKRLLTEDIILKTDMGAQDTTVMGDATQIDQILLNLAANARDAMPRGGTLTIGTSRVRMDQPFEDVDGYGEPGTYTLICISDTGVGMDEETRGHIFDPFFTTKETGKGTGLGLSTVYGIVKQHNGYIQLLSIPGRGTTFRIYLPSITAKLEKEEAAAVSRPVHGGKETILVAEDNEAVRTLFRTILAGHGYTVIEAGDGQAAVESFREHRDIDLIIVDSVMPKKNGREVYDEIRKVRPYVKALFTSGYTRDVVLDKGIEEDELHFISKPVTPDDLLAKVREVLG